jgi:hypothetical protein
MDNSGNTTSNGVAIQNVQMTVTIEGIPGQM